MTVLKTSSSLIIKMLFGTPGTLEIHPRIATKISTRIPVGVSPRIRAQNFRADELKFTVRQFSFTCLHIHIQLLDTRLSTE